MSGVTRNPNHKIHSNPNTNPVSNTNPYPKTVPPANSKSVTFDEVSKLFSLPLADAADSLGVCTSVLKKICHDNGLARWPYRKFLFGKSIEQIKEDAAREKTKRRKEVLKASARVREDSAIPTATSVPGSQLHNKTTSYTQEVLKSQAVTQAQGNKNLQVGGPPMPQGSDFTKGSQPDTDEFIYGFPSNGLSTISYRWWGKSSSSGSTNSSAKPSEATSVDSNSNASKTDDLQNEGHGISTGSLETGSLSSLRKRAAEEGREALKLGAHRRYATSKLDPAKKMVLQQVFKSSLPTQLSD